MIALYLEDKADSTLQNAIYSKDIINNEHFNSATIVTSDYHMRRAKMIFDKEFKNSVNVIHIHPLYRDLPVDIQGRTI